MSVNTTSKTGPARRYIGGKLVDGYIELTSDYIAFRPIVDPEHIGFLAWHELRGIKLLKANYIRPVVLEIRRINGNAPLVFADPATHEGAIEEWIDEIEKAHYAYLLRWK